MERSRINRLIDNALAFLHDLKFQLPPFAHWTAEEWGKKGPEHRAIVDEQLGWDVTDFGVGEFDRRGLLLFTLRNGSVTTQPFKPYAEKVLIVQPGQCTPCHFHSRKMEDIINRGGGELVLQLWQSDDFDGLSAEKVTVAVNSVPVEVKAGGTVTLKPGDSICLPPRLYHAFWALAGSGSVLAGEVSSFNDDLGDNHFYEPAGRFPDITEDREPRYLLIPDYPHYYRFGQVAKQSKQPGS